MVGSLAWGSAIPGLAKSFELPGAALDKPLGIPKERV